MIASAGKTYSQNVTHDFPQGPQVDVVPAPLGFKCFMHIQFARICSSKVSHGDWLEMLSHPFCPSGSHPKGAFTFRLATTEGMERPTLVASFEGRVQNINSSSGFNHSVHDDPTPSKVDIRSPGLYTKNHRHSATAWIISTCPETFPAASVIKES